MRHEAGADGGHDWSVVGQRQATSEAAAHRWSGDLCGRCWASEQDVLAGNHHGQEARASGGAQRPPDHC